MTGGLLRGTPGDNIGPTPAGIIGSTSGGLSKLMSKPRLRRPLRPQRSRSKGTSRPLEDRTRVTTVVKGKEIGDADLKRPFKEAVKTFLTRRIIEFASPEFKMPANIKLYDGTTDPEDHLSRSRPQQTQVNDPCRCGVVCSNKPWMGAREDGSRTSQEEASTDGWNSGSSS
ncbi:hypothetical protein Tco_1028762 [Tanacetum coccineum]|uniref:Uncharacterized protein n=1 Tax=Tanacetum coccineum TaxID=301880 RepID=A0ABQ5G1U4_9ASTR